jgi:hypothetical protein
MTHQGVREVMALTWHDVDCEQLFFLTSPNLQALLQIIMNNESLVENLRRITWDITPKHNFHDYNNVGQCPKLSHVAMKTILSYPWTILNVLYHYATYVHAYVIFLV